jgi:hypothetical protein
VLPGPRTLFDPEVRLGTGMLPAFLGFATLFDFPALLGPAEFFGPKVSFGFDPPEPAFLPLGTTFRSGLPLSGRLPGAWDQGGAGLESICAS